MEQLIRPIWEVEPSSFVTIRQKGKLIAFYGKIPLNEKILRVLAKEPLFHPFIKGWKSQPNAFLLSFMAIEPELEEKTRGYIIHTIINDLVPVGTDLDFYMFERMVSGLRIIWL